MNKKLFALALLVLPACSTITPEQQVAAVRSRAIYDLNCDAGNLEVTYLQPNTYGVKGCRKQQVYELEGLQVYKEGMVPARNYYYYDDYPRVGMGLSYGRYYR